MSVTDTVEKTTDGAILYDSDVLSQMSEQMFVSSGWVLANSVQGILNSAGRGNTVIVSDGINEFVLRHYLRGGFPSRIIKDTYFWTGEACTRSFREFRLLSKLRNRGLPVPQPVGARYCRSGLIYRADLLTRRIPGICSLAERIIKRSADTKFWWGIGRNLRRFHLENVYHADMNAYNVQLDSDDNLYLLDFDRGRFRKPGTWMQQNLACLNRSLLKIASLDKRAIFSQSEWDALLAGYFSESRSA